jgi:hypothetical protein
VVIVFFEGVAMEVNSNFGIQNLNIDTTNQVPEKGPSTTTKTIGGTGSALRKSTFSKRQFSGAEVNRDSADSVVSPLIENDRSNSAFSAKEGGDKPKMSRGLSRRLSQAFSPRKITLASTAEVKGGVTAETSDQISDAVLMQQGEKLKGELYKNLKKLKVTDIADGGFAKTTTTSIMNRQEILDKNGDPGAKEMDILLGQIALAGQLNVFLIEAQKIKTSSVSSRTELSDLKNSIKKQNALLHASIKPLAGNDDKLAAKTIKKITAMAERNLDELEKTFD